MNAKNLIVLESAEKCSTNKNIFKINLFDQNRIKEITELLSSKMADSVVESHIEHKKRN